MPQCDAVGENDAFVIDDGLNETVVSSHGGTHLSTQTQDIFPNENALSITKSDSVDEATICYSPSWSFHAEFEERNSRVEDAQEECDVPAMLPTSLKFNRNTMSIFVKRTGTKSDEAKQSVAELCQSELNDEVENGINSPNLPITRDTTHFHDTRSSRSATHFNPFNADEKYSRMCESIADYDELNARGKRSERLMKLLQSKDPLQSAVVLRSPRGNQPRAYTTEALYSALMDVKSGESIYR